MAAQLPEAPCEQLADLPPGHVQLGFEFGQAVGTMAVEAEWFDDHFTLERRQIVEEVGIGAHPIRRRVNQSFRRDSRP